MGGNRLLHVYNSSHAYQMKRLTAYIPMSVKRYSQGKNVHDKDEHGQEQERAPSTAQEFKRVAEEKSHTSEKAQDGFEEAAKGESGVESAKERLKDPPGVGNSQKPGETSTS